MAGRTVEADWRREMLDARHTFHWRAPFPKLAPIKPLWGGRAGGTFLERGRILGMTQGNQDSATTELDRDVAARLKRDRDGLVPAVVQQYDSGEVLMLAWMDDEALRRTLATGRATYFSRSRGKLWVKGETSGHHQYVRSVAIDCDGD